MRPQDPGFTLLELVVVLAIAAFVVSLALPTVVSATEKENRIRCAQNLHLIGRAINKYAEDNMRLGGVYPRVSYSASAAIIVGATGADFATVVPGTKNSVFSTAARDAAAPGGIGVNNVPAALFLLLRTQKLSPSAFVCPSTKATPDDLRRGGVLRFINQCGNFAGDGDVSPSAPPGGRVTRHLSYGYANPYAGTAGVSRGFRMNLSMNPDFAVMADLGPGLFGAGDDVYRSANVNAPGAELKFMNSNNHGKEGQNVLFADGHVDWTPTPFAGVKRNHLYVPDSHFDYSVTPQTEDEISRKWYKGDATPGKVSSAVDAKAIDAADSVILPWDD